MATKTPTPDPDDWLGYSAYADALWGRVARALDKDKNGQKLGDDPLVVGIFGEWGAGKSALLKLMQARADTAMRAQISARESDPGFGLTVPVWFQPWKYEHEEHLHVPMVIHVLNALKDALKHDPSVVQALVELTTQATEKFEHAKPTLVKCAKAAKSAFPVVQKILKSISVFGISIDLPDEINDWLEAAADAAEKDEKGKKPSEAKKKQKPIDLAPKHSNDGAYFYRIHELLGALTRPDSYQDRQSLFDHAKTTPQTRINFVVFIDDLDRCLPEKAVQTLELIKTIFNIESFAFVLALDDEVIERGIGHRYQAYNFAGKKPEMPITGFEYLEKIVHVPFRLPALTLIQAKAFVRRYEESIEGDASLRWFDALETKDDDDNLNDAGRTLRQSDRPDLLALALSGFDAYMPRKLIRMVELLHQWAHIARLRKKPLLLNPGGYVDIRVVLALLLIQLFQPELFRIIRRRPGCFPALLAAFSSSKDFAEFDTDTVSDIDLWRWAISSNQLDQANVWDGNPVDGTYSNAVSIIAKLHVEKPAERNTAQHIRLPLVMQLIEHRAAQRHVFDVLKLTFSLAQSMDATNSQAHQLNFETYRSLLSEEEALATEVVASGVFALRNVKELAEVLVSTDTAAQANISTRFEFKAKQVIDAKSVEVLVSALKQHQSDVAGNNPKGVSQEKLQLLNGLQFIVPFIAPDEGKDLWALVADSVDFTKPIEKPKLLALWGYVRAALGCDNRFDPKRPYLMQKRFKGHSEEDEPLPGFVRIPAGAFMMGSAQDSNNPEREVTIEQPFYIQRTLVTVAQYAQFVDDKGYVSDNYWDAQGIEWRNGKFDSAIEDKAYKEWLAQRTPDLRNTPWEWEKQKSQFSSPVQGVTWFEARAYTRWLTATLPSPYTAMLPTEVQWERAARAASLTATDARQWPWGDDEAVAEQQANVKQAIGSVCAVGLFPPNPIGLYDMAGNAWEWMDNLYQIDKPDSLRIGEHQALKSGKTFDDSDKPTLRGGSWFYSPGLARCSSRSGNLPDSWFSSLGFRVVLSLATPKSGT